MAYSDDYRKRAVEYRDSGYTFAELREAFKIPARTYYDWKQKFAEGYYDVKVKRTRKRKIDREKLRQAVAEKPDAYLRELAEQFACTEQAVFYMLRNLGITLKKIILVQRAVGGKTSGVQGQAEEGSRRKARLCGRERRRRPYPARKRPRAARRKGRGLQARQAPQARERRGGVVRRRVLRAHVLPAGDQLRLVRGVVQG